MQAKELGVRSVIIDGPDSWCQNLQDVNMIEKFIGIDFSHAESVFDKCLAACKKVQKVSSLCLFVCTLVISLVIGHICVCFLCFIPHLIVFSHFTTSLHFSPFLSLQFLFSSVLVCLYSQHDIMSASQHPQANLPGAKPNATTNFVTLRARFGRVSVLLSHKH